MKNNRRVAIIGGGAAGFFAAISCKIHHPDTDVIIYEKSDKLLAKVKISGGGRCNVTHACFDISDLSQHYPRGGKQLKKAFGYFNTKDTVEWFESRGVKLKTEADNRMFPVTDNSQTIIDCLIQEVQRLGIQVLMQTSVNAIEKNNTGFRLSLKGKEPAQVDKVIVATGGSPKPEGLDWLKNSGHNIAPPVPSLFTFNMPHETITGLMGISVDPVSVSVRGTKLKSRGPLLITHWGMSGPAILKLSAWGARILYDMNYRFSIQVNWLGDLKEDEARKFVRTEAETNRKRKVGNRNPFQLPGRLWLFLLTKAGISHDVPWGETGKKNQNRLLNILLNDVYSVEGKTTFKEEFVTCGGVSLKDLDMRTMESRICPGLYFAGEVLDIDGLTGGFNFQAAWTTGFIAGKLSV